MASADTVDRDGPWRGGPDVAVQHVAGDVVCPVQPAQPVLAVPPHPGPAGGGGSASCGCLPQSRSAPPLALPPCFCIASFPISPCLLCKQFLCPPYKMCQPSNLLESECCAVCTSAALMPKQVVPILALQLGTCILHSIMLQAGLAIDTSCKTQSCAGQGKARAQP